MWLRCGVQFEFRYIQGLKIPPGISARRGSAVHKAAEVNHLQKLSSKTDLSREELQAVAADEFNRLVYGDESEGVYISKEEAPDKATEKKICGQMLDQAIDATGVYRREIAPGIQPDKVEEELTGEVKGLAISGRVDLIDVSGNIIDLKVHKSKNQTWADRAIQPTFYSAMYAQRFERKPAAFVYEGIVPNKTMIRQRLETTRDKADFDRLEVYLQRFLESVTKETFTPADPDSWICDPRYCGYFNICKFGRGR